MDRFHPIYKIKVVILGKYHSLKKIIYLIKGGFKLGDVGIF
tara:strand:+ start:693 stop:815 length:123 start_codon:yes stop_codon:yes gene_type:complete